MAWIILHLKTQKKTQPLNDSPGIYDHRKKKNQRRNDCSGLRSGLLFPFSLPPTFSAICYYESAEQTLGALHPGFNTNPINTPIVRIF